MHDRHEQHVLAALERDLNADPALGELAAQLPPCDSCAGQRTRRRGAAPVAPLVLTTGLGLTLLGCLVLSVPLSVLGILTAIVALVLAARGTDHHHPASSGLNPVEPRPGSNGDSC